MEKGGIDVLQASATVSAKVRADPLDAAPPPQPVSQAAGPSAPQVLVAPAATDERPRGAAEADLCERASHVDWLYLGGALAADVGSIWLDLNLKYNESRGVRYLGPAAVGLSLGWSLGGGYLALPKCSPDWVASAPPEGDVRAPWPVAFALAGLAGIVSPIIMGAEVGPLPQAWPVGERSMRVVLASAAGVSGALLPYLLPPKTWRAAKELEHLRAGATDDGRGAFVTWAVRF
jgi:hypothetical protein